MGRADSRLDRIKLALHIARVLHDDPRFNPHEPAEWPDTCKTDTLADTLTERFPRLTSDEARGVAELITTEARRIGEEVAADKFRAFLFAVYDRRGPQDEELVALAFAANIDGLTPFRTLAEAGDALGMTRANMSRKAQIIRQALGLRPGTHQKSDEQRAAQSEARRRFCELKKNASESKGGQRQ